MSTGLASLMNHFPLKTRKPRATEADCELNVTTGEPATNRKGLHPYFQAREILKEIWSLLQLEETAKEGDRSKAQEEIENFKERKNELFRKFEQILEQATTPEFYQLPNGFSDKSGVVVVSPTAEAESVNSEILNAPCGTDFDDQELAMKEKKLISKRESQALNTFVTKVSKDVANLKSGMSQLYNAILGVKKDFSAIDFSARMSHCSNPKENISETPSTGLSQDEILSNLNEENKFLREKQYEYDKRSKVLVEQQLELQNIERKNLRLVKELQDLNTRYMELKDQEIDDRENSISKLEKTIKILNENARKKEVENQCRMNSMSEIIEGKRLEIENLESLLLEKEKKMKQLTKRTNDLTTDVSNYLYEMQELQEKLKEEEKLKVELQESMKIKEIDFADFSEKNKIIEHKHNIEVKALKDRISQLERMATR